MGESTSAGRLVGRRRRANADGGRRRHAHQVKVTPEEEAVLVRLAGEQRVTVPRLLVESTLVAAEGAVGSTPTERRDAMVELFAVHRLLGALSNNVNQMAKATNATHEVAEDMTRTLAVVRRTADRVDVAIDGLSGS